MKKILFFSILVSVFLLLLHILNVKGITSYFINTKQNNISYAEQEKELEKILNIKIYSNEKYSDSNIKEEFNIEKIKIQKRKEYNENLYWLSRIVSAEAKGECEEGQIAVANVVLNRVASKQFPNDIKSVIFQPKQFSPVINGSIYDNPTEQAIKSARLALNGVKVIDKKVLYFYNPKLVSENNWIKTRKIVKRIGNHVFCY